MLQSLDLCTSGVRAEQTGSSGHQSDLLVCVFILFVYLPSNLNPSGSTADNEDRVGRPDLPLSLIQEVVPLVLRQCIVRVDRLGEGVSRAQRQDVVFEFLLISRLTHDGEHLFLWVDDLETGLDELKTFLPSTA